MMNVHALVTTAVIAASTTAASAQVKVLVTDRVTDSVYLLHDDNNDGTIQQPSEVTLWFGPGNASGLPGVLNPNTIGYRNGLCLIGDQDATARRIYWTRDLNGDGDAMDAGEAGVFADLTTAAGQSFAFPTGIAFDTHNVPFIINAGNGFGPDAIWRCEDANADGDANDPGETRSYTVVNGFSLTNGTYSPQEIWFDHSDVLYMRNSSTGLHGLWRLADDDHNGTIEAGEWTLFFGATNASGITLSAGFAVELDPLHGRSLFFHQIASGSNDQIIRLVDQNADGDAMDPGEATIVFSTTETGFTSIDILALNDGSVLFSDNSGKRIIRLRDLDGDGLFNSPGERSDFLSTSSVLGDVRNMALVHDTGCGPADLGRQGGVAGGDGVLDNNDFVVFIDYFFTQAPISDVGRQGGVPGFDGIWDNNDFIVFIDQFFAGC